MCKTTTTTTSVVVESKERDYDEANLKESYDEARKAVSNGCMPFGAVLSDDKGKIIARASNPTPAIGKRGGATTHDCTGHAEVTLLQIGRAHV